MPWIVASWRSAACSGQTKTSPSSRGPATCPVSSMGNERTSVGSSRPRCSRLSSRIRVAGTSATARCPSAMPAERSATAAAPRSSAGTSERSRRSPPGGTSALVAGPPLVLAVGGDDPLNELVSHHVLAAESYERDVGDLDEDLPDHHQPRALVARQVDLGDVASHHHPGAEAEPGQEHLHLLGTRVLGLVEDHERVINRAASHKSQW